MKKASKEHRNQQIACRSATATAATEQHTHTYTYRHRQAQCQQYYLVLALRIAEMYASPTWKRMAQQQQTLVMLAGLVFCATRTATGMVRFVWYR